MMKRLTANLLTAALAFAAAGVANASGEDMERKLAADFEAGALRGLHSVLVLKDGETFAEAHFRGADESWGVPLGERDHGPETLHDIRSVTKSVVGLLYGIALADGIAPAPTERLLDHFPEYADLATEPARREMTVGHALSMKMGVEWDEDRPYTDPRNSEIAMEMAQDRYRFALDRPMVDEPGARWTYNGGATALVARLIEKGAGMPLDAYAEKALFTPLGVKTYEWVHGRDGTPSAASGLRLSVHDLAKIGMMVANGGVHDGAAVVPASWIEAIRTPRADLPFGLRYGYFWWLAAEGEPPNWLAGFGNGGQRLSVNPELGLVVAITAGRYNEMDAWRLPVKVITEYVTPALGLD